MKDCLWQRNIVTSDLVFQRTKLLPNSSSYDTNSLTYHIFAWGALAPCTPLLLFAVLYNLLAYTSQLGQYKPRPSQLDCYTLADCIFFTVASFRNMLRIPACSSIFLWVPFPIAVICDLLCRCMPLPLQPAVAQR